MQVDTSVAEADVGKLAARHGGHASPSTRSPASASRARCGRSATRRRRVQNVVTYDAVIDVDNPELKLRPGMTANVTFVYAEQDDVLAGAERRAALPAAAELLAAALGRTGASAGTASPVRDGAAGAGARGAGGVRRAGPDAAVWVLRDGQARRRRR